MFEKICLIWNPANPSFLMWERGDTVLPNDRFLFVTYGDRYFDAFEGMFKVSCWDIPYLSTWIEQGYNEEEHLTRKLTGSFLSLPLWGIE